MTQDSAKVIAQGQANALARMGVDSMGAAIHGGIGLSGVTITKNTTSPSTIMANIQIRRASNGFILAIGGEYGVPATEYIAMNMAEVSDIIIATLAAAKLEK